MFDILYDHVTRDIRFVNKHGKYYKCIVIIVGYTAYTGLVLKWDRPAITQMKIPAHIVGMPFILY